MTELPAMLQTAHQNGTTPRAVLLEGASAAQRKETALTFSRILLGAGIDTSPDFLFLEGGLAVNSFHIEDVRLLQEKIALFPARGDVSVFVLHNAQSLTPQGQNALLKVLEEPPAHAYIILTAPRRHLLLPTIRSRVTHYDLGAPLAESEDETRRAQAETAAQNLLDAYLLPGQNGYAVFSAVTAFEKDYDLLRATFPVLHTKLRTVLHTAAASAGAQTQSAKLIALCALLERVAQIEQSMQRNANHTLVLTRLAAAGMHTRDAA
jgi:hypothetical protein